MVAALAWQHIVVVKSGRFGVQVRQGGAEWGVAAVEKKGRWKSDNSVSMGKRAGAVAGKSL